uniref:Pistil extensin-like protein III n=1 Tax=Nicotiana stocktonii TaxID=118710 RepID=A0A223HHA6_9SOLA|nr:pistil extensin-like protein III [Nicotiana stocktonii]
MAVIISSKVLLIQLFVLVLGSFSKPSHGELWLEPPLPFDWPPAEIQSPPPSPPPPPPSTIPLIPPFNGGFLPPLPGSKLHGLSPLIPNLPDVPPTGGDPPVNRPRPSAPSPPVMPPPPPPSSCKPSPPDQSTKQSPPPPPAKQPPPPPPPPPVKAPSPSPAKQSPPPPRAPSPSPATQPPTKQPSPIAYPPVMAPSPSPAAEPPIVAPFPSPTANPPMIPRRPAPPVVKPLPPLGKPPIVSGLVYCKSCNSYGVPTLFDASLLQGAVVKLICCGKKAMVQWATTDNKGEFRIMPKSLITADVGKCKVYLVKSPNPNCNVPTNFNGGKSGALLKPVLPPKQPTTPAVVPVQPFIFEASSKMPCFKDSRAQARKMGIMYKSMSL